MPNPKLTTSDIEWDEESLKKARRRQNIPRDIGLAIAPLGAAYGAARSLPLVSGGVKEAAKQLEMANLLRHMKRTEDFLPENMFMP